MFDEKSFMEACKELGIKPEKTNCDYFTVEGKPVTLERMEKLLMPPSEVWRYNIEFKYKNKYIEPSDKNIKYENVYKDRLFFEPCMVKPVA